MAQSAKFDAIRKPLSPVDIRIGGAGRDPSIAAQAETRLFFDVHQRHHIRPLSAAGRAGAEAPQVTRAGIDNMTYKLAFEDEEWVHGCSL